MAPDTTDNSEGSGGRDASRVELIVGGSLLVNGTIDDHVTFRGTDTTFAGGWYGVWFDDDSTTDRQGKNTSSISYTDFSAPVFAIGVDSLSGSIVHCTFANSQSGDIYVEGDTRIPVGYQWLLDAPTTVVVSDTDASDNWGPSLEEDSARVEIVVEGLLETHGSATDSVHFTSAAGSPASDDWFGIIGRWGTLYLDYADVGYATDPVYFEGVSTARVWNSTIHDFRDTGILDYGADAWIKNSVIDGGTGPSPEDGRVGIHVAVSTTRIEGTTVDWSNAGGSDAYGIKVEFSKNHCDNLSGSDTLRIQSTEVVGNGETSGDDNTGLFVFWGCEDHHPRIDRNDVSGWDLHGIKLQNCAETQLTCNVVEQNDIGVFYTRTSAVAGDSVTFYQNQLQFNQNRNLSTDAAYKLLLRQAGGNGKNEFREDTTSVVESRNIETNDASLTMPAQANLWTDSTGVITDSTSIAHTIVGTGTVNHANPLASVSTNCQGGGLPPGALAGIGSAEAPESSPQAAGLAEALPTEFALRPTAPNPLRAATEIAYNVPAGYAGRVNVSVYDVTGRRVKSLVDGQVPPGRHRALWGGEDTNGVRSMAGVYFVHLRADGYEATRKVVLIR
jgi:hypothetical protein